mgnify:CR=1 FL=1
MDKIIYFFNQLNIKIALKENTEKLGIKKDNSTSNSIINISFYQIENHDYLLGIKRSGRPQFILFNKNMDILINKPSQASFIREIEQYFPKNEEDKNKIIGQVLRKLRQKLKIPQIELSKRINKKSTTLRKYENGQLNISPKVLNEILAQLNISLEEYKTFFCAYLKKEKLEYKFNDFITNKEIVTYKPIVVDETKHLNIHQLVTNYKINMSLAYRYMKIANEELRERGETIISGKVDKNKFEEIYWRFNNER